MDENTRRKLSNRLDETILSLTDMIQADVYENVILATVRFWFESNDSVTTLNEKIQQSVEARWPFVEKKVAVRLREFEEATRVALTASTGPAKGALDQGAIADGVSQGISTAIGAIGTAFVAMISGGSGAALIAVGPAGWLIGGVLGATAFIAGKTRVEAAVSHFIVDKKIPAMFKRPARKKVLAELKLKQAEFEQQVHALLEKKLKPVYEVLTA